MITSNHYYSLIFKNIETEGNTFVQNLKSIFLNGFNGIFASLKTQDFSFTNTFSTSLEQDRAALLAYREAINNNVPATEAFEQTMTGASVAAQEFAKNNDLKIKKGTALLSSAPDNYFMPYFLRRFSIFSWGSMILISQTR